MVSRTTARQDVDAILRARAAEQVQELEKRTDDVEAERSVAVRSAEEAFAETVVEAAKSGQRTAKLLELDDEGAPLPSAGSGAGRESLRSSAYQKFWDFVASKGFQPSVQCLADTGGDSLREVGFRSESRWICCRIE